MLSSKRSVDEEESISDEEADKEMDIEELYK